MRWALVACACMWACGAPPAAPLIGNQVQEAAVAGPSMVLGTIVDARTGEGIGGATVTIGTGDHARSAISDARGVYRVTLANGRHRLRLSYLQLELERVIEVVGPTKVEQELDQRWLQGSVSMRCTSGFASTCSVVR
ncbi:MAG: carboxypeptidase regulatory-like domain-containing protein [Deltaproteobacteria bacterium]|nr:carboxypeptidase regulatory-like domain-containing protein [Deltaproteobacteria bacterium]